ncbi:uncharacterized protein CTHT_0008540 [Thermochaetoides thermophila DSM 1495]|uniref:RNA binding protein n=1 Tax=Chaetomium thermophilum (strain DSM 1495 / CBS 144.50 / IMI 039719) TaxID=759272 RepID=G0S030_CHATD|nr:hypothetical protein CTHT_0008540 [Thermochaetoides thermophila DSM 1495]EGS23191.1 hypothetical protein CTHT_0008540 [Thermochaetoides thermophila DSM 1495]
MAAPPVTELEAGLQAMLALKPPGVSGSRIQSLTALCVANVQYESVLIQKLFTHFKKTPGTHKLGVLYVVDSVTRKWLDQAKAQGQAPSASAPDGTFAAGVHRVTVLIPMMMNDIISSAPDDQKEKIRKLVDIWEKGQTFPSDMVNSFKEKLNARPTNESTTPPGSPPAELLASFGAGSKPLAAATAAPVPLPTATTALPPNSAIPSILDKLASIARQNASSAAGTTQSNPSLAAPTSAPTSAPAPAAGSNTVPASVFGTSGGPPSSAAVQPAPVPVQAQPAMPFFPPSSQPAAQSVNVPAALPFAYPSQPQAVGPAPAAPAAPAAPVAPGPSVLSNGTSNPAAATTVQLVAALLAQGIPADKIAGVIQMMTQAGALPAASQPQMPQPTQTGYAAPPVPVAGTTPTGSAPWDAPRPDDMRDRSGYHDRPRGRSRSRSPSRWDPRGSPRSRSGFDYGRPGSPSRGRLDDRDRGRADYRQRSPRGRRGDSPGREPIPQEKWVEYDNTLPNGHIKVYSRTLFVGGVTCSEQELRDLFNRYGKVQTCIVNREKRHAFVKMYYRKDAERAKTAMEEVRSQDYNLRTRWGVGFGPRDCSDYSTGISVIPIHKLTEADRKWMLTAPFGGSGGRPIVSGMCVEEPDIEIGAGVSSKAISRRMQTDKSGHHGPKSTRREEEANNGGGGGRWRHRDKHHKGDRNNDKNNNNNNNNNNDEPIVESLPAGVTLGPNGINFAPNFQFNAPANN